MEWLVPVGFTLFWVALAVSKGHLRLAVVGIGIQLAGGAVAGVIEGLGDTDASNTTLWITAVSGSVGAIVVVVAGVRLAMPNSWYARRMYDEEKMLRAEARYADASAERIRAGEELDRRAGSSFTFGCRLCGEAFDSQVAAENHVARLHAAAVAAPEDAVEQV